MHSLVLVVGPSVHEQLHPFSDHTKVDPYRVYFEGDQLRSMAEHFGLPETDLEALAAKMPEWNECEAEIHAGRISYWCRENPNGKYDFYKIGGRFSEYLVLKEPRRPSFVGRLLGRRPSSRANRAQKQEVVVGDVLGDPPFAILANGAWVEQGWGSDAPTDERWKQQFTERFNLVGDEELITVVDVHS